MTIIHMADIKIAVAEHFRMTPERLIAVDRRNTMIMVRAVAYRLCRDLTGESLSAIGRCFGDRDHTTVMSGLRRLEGHVGLEFKAATNIIKDKLLTSASHSPTTVQAVPFKSRRKSNAPVPAHTYIRRHSA